VDEQSANTQERAELEELEEYRYWQSRPVHERLARVCELSLELYGMKGQAPPKMDKTLVRVERTKPQ
jgi:hypothetical protein